ncbi:protein DCL [Populus alba x Populus x berolinensis]|nr:protein DCL [Populus alba x Populus x berolinensis]
MAASALIRGAPLLRLRLQHHHRFATGLLVPLRRSWCSTVESTPPEEDGVSLSTPAALSLRKAPKYSSWDDQNYRQWKDEEADIWRDIEPITHLAKEIIHSDRYKDGEQLTDEDEKAVAGRLLVYHPNCDDKVGCGLDSIAHFSSCPWFSSCWF